MNFRRFSLSGDSVENEIDAAFKNLYPSSMILEKKCEDSLKESLSSRFPVIHRAQTRTIGRVKLSNGKSVEQIMNTLSSQYFTQNYDPVETNLIEISSWKENDITQKFMSKIEDSDNDKDVIVSHLTSMIDANYDQLMECMKKIQEINVDLFEAGMQIQHSRMKISSSINFVDSGAISITTLTKRREKMAGLIDILRGLKAVKDINGTMNLKLKTGDVGDAAEYARDMFNCFEHSSFAKFTALQTIKSNMPKTIYSIKQKTDKALRRLSCRKFATGEYDSIMKSYLILNNLLREIQVDEDDQFFGMDDEDDFFEEVGNGNCLETLAQRITKFQLEDIDGCFHAAVMELIYLAQQQKQQAAAEVEVEGAFQQLGLEEIMDLTETPLNLLYKRITPELFPKCVIRCCELLAEVVHTHYLITQWHTSPFDARNNDSTFLHRSHKFSDADKFDDSEDEADRVSPISFSAENSSDDSEEEVFESNNIRRHSQNSKLNFSALDEPFAQSIYGKSIVSISTQKLIRQLEVLMTLQYRNLINSRDVIWNELVNGIVSMLNSLTFSSGTKFEDFLAMIRSLRLMIRLGKDFCGSTSESLEDAIKEKAEEFVFHFHVESFQVIRMMIEAESWRNISIYCDENDTILTVLSSFMRDESDGSKISSQSDKPSVSFSSLLESFPAYGNPFTVREGEGNIKFNTLKSGLAHDSATQQYSSIVDLLHDAIYEETKKGKGSGKIYSMLMNQVSLNGIAKFLMNYLNIMSHLPTTAVSIFDYICQLFDFYLCSVFYGFTPAEERNKFLSTQSKIVAPPPDSSREFDVLRRFLERMMGGMICVGSSSCSTDDDAVSRDSGYKRNYDMVKVSTLLSVPLVVEEADSPSFFAITERITAAESCGFLAQVLSESKYLFSKLLPEKDVHKCDSYIENFVMITGQLRSYIYKAMCPELHFSDQVVINITDCSWEAKKTRDVHHPWVDRLISINKQIWSYLLEVNQFGESSVFVREQIWLEVCQSAFDIAIEGFSRVRKCSPEGRAAMSMDTFALHDGLNSIHLCRPPRGKHYVDNYLRAFYMNEEEIMQWVQDNWQSYSYRHIHGLLSQTMTSILNSKKLKDALAVIDGLYENESVDKVSTMFSSRFKEDNKLSTILTSKFRRQSQYSAPANN